MEKISYPKEIQHFFSEIALDVKSVLDPEFLLIAGSFGKGSWLYLDDKLISDFEFVFVCNKKWSLKKKKKLLFDLNSKFNFDISLKGYLLNNVQNKVVSNYSKKYFGYIDLNFFDTFSDPIVLYSKKNLELEIDVSCSEIPAWEAWRLYVNRMGDLLSLAFKKESKTQEKYYWLKIFESIAEAYLLINNIYSKNIISKMNSFTLELLRKDKKIDTDCIDSYKWVKMAMFSRSRHELSLFEIVELKNRKRNRIIYSWLRYFEEKVCVEELNLLSGDNFIQSYISNKVIQKKYLEVNNYFAIQISNTIRCITRFNALAKLKFKFKNIIYSWRHFVLLTVRQAYMEHSNNSNEFVNTKKLLRMVIPQREINRLSNWEQLSLVHKLWKELR